MRRLTILEWVPLYRREDLRGDLTAGLTGAALLIPQSMAYAQLGGVPPVVGLYASVIPAIAYACFGRSRQLTIGPLTTISIIGALAVGNLAPEGSDRFVLLTATLAFMVGAVAVLLAAARFGALMHHVREPLIIGFLAGAAIVIMANQLHTLFGYSSPPEPRAWETLWEWADRLDETNVTSLVIGVVGIVLLTAVRRFGRIPGALLYVVAATVVVSICGLDAVVVGDVPSGLAGFSVPPLEWEVIRGLALAAIAITFVGYAEAFGVARRLAEEHRYPIDANRELFAVGSANVTAGFFAGMPVTGVPSRTSVVDEAGARTQLSALAGIVVIVPLLLWGTSLLRDLPMSALAAVVLVSIASFIRVGELRRMWHDERWDAWLALTVFAAVVILGLELGIALAAVVAIVDVVVQHRRNTRA